MIDTHIYQLQAELPSTKLDENGRQTLQWTTVYAQVTKDTFEYSVSKKRAFKGDYDDEIPKCKVIYLVGKDEGVVKLEQSARKDKDQQIKVILIKEDENCPNDFHRVCNIIREQSKAGKDLGRPIVINSHTGRGVSGLSRNAENSNYKGIVNILVILLILSNLHNVIKTIDENGWAFGNTILQTIIDLRNFEPRSLKYVLSFQYLVSSLLISFGIEKYLAPNPSVPRPVVFALIVLNMTHILVFPVW